MPPKRMQKQSLSQRLERWSLTEDGDIELEQDVVLAIDRASESVGFDWAAPSTTGRRNRYLREYEHAMQASAKSEGVECDEKYLWGEENLQKNIRVYIELAAAIIQPRSYESPSATFGALVQRRQAFLYWAPRKCPADFKMTKLFIATQEALRHAARKFHMTVDQQEKHYLTKYDLAMLLEYGMWLEQSPEVAQQQHLCWLMGFVLGVRPGSIGFSRGWPDQYLQWKDVEISRKSGNNFAAKIVFRWMKGYRDEARKPLKFTCSGPASVDDAMYSIPHRVLAILLQRGLLQQHTSLESLLSGKEIYIAIKPSAMELPVILSSSPKGLTLDPVKAASGESISSYLHRRALGVGLPPGITHYAWRRSAATNIGRVLGADTAKEALGHTLNHDAFETAYKQGTETLDLFAVSMGRTMSTAADLLEDEALSVNRIKVQTIARRKWVEKYINDDVEFQEQFRAVTSLGRIAEDSKASSDIESFDKARKLLSSMHRTLTRRAQIALQRVELQNTKSSMTLEELEQRRIEVRKPGKLQSMLLAAAKEANPDKEDIQIQGELYEENDFMDARDITTDNVLEVE